MSTADLEPEGGVVTDPFRALQGLSQLATSPDPPLRAIQIILSSYSFSQSQDNGKRPHETDLGHGTGKKARGDEHSARWPCELCPRSYSNKGNLQRHVKSAHANKKRLVVAGVFQCEECEYTGATKAALETHMDTHASSSDAKSPKYNCAFCNKERTGIYIHYGSHHKIDYPEQILFDNGNVLVRSNINTDNGKAPWFLKEKEKMELYDDVTCRLCETTTSFDNREILADHYTLYHQVDTAKLDNLKRLFRAEKGAHLIGLTQTPKRKQSDISTLREKVPYRKEKMETHNKTNQKTRLHVVFDCKECNQVYDSEALLDKHRNDKHGPKTEEKTKSVKYTCTFCRKDVAQIYKHYGNAHNMEYPEQMLFDNGNLLVRADINTNGGQAPWFLREKEKAESRYTLSTCRLCETEYGKIDLLEKHYLSEHKVKSDVLDDLNNLRCLFRADKAAHLADLPDSRASKRQKRIMSQTISRPVNKTESETNAAGSGAHAEQKTVIEEYAAGLIMYQCEECGVAATTCDASIEHAQLHHLSGGYKPIPLTCDICSFAFEAPCFADHTNQHHLSRDQYKIVKFRPSKLLDEWSEMFQDLSESHANRIKASSTYQYTRMVKMNSKEAAGIPMYQCGKCELYVRPRDVEGHCYSKTSCGDSQAPGHFCSDCEIYFYSCAGLTDHEKEHRKYGNDCFRKVTFNCREDEPINRALQKLQKETVEETPVKTQDKNKQTINVIENVVVSRFCSECKKSILSSEYEAHAATHQVENAAFEHESNQGIDDQQEQNCLNSNQSAAEVTPQNAVMETEGTNVDGVVEQWSSDSDSCPSLRAFSCVVHVDVHNEKVEIEDVLQSEQIEMTDKNDEAGAAGDVQDMNNQPEVDLSYQIQDIMFEEFSENMTSELKREIEDLGLRELGIGTNQLAYIPDSLLEALENDERNSKSIHDSDNKSENISQGIFFAVTQIGSESRGTSPDVFNATTQTGVHDAENNINLANTHANQITNNVEMSGAADKEDSAITTYENIF